MARLLYFLEKNIPTLFWLLLSIIRIARPKKKKRKKKNTLVSINKGDEKILTRAAAKLFFLIDFP